MATPPASGPDRWTTSTHSNQQDCVQWRRGARGVDVRDSKAAGPHAPVLAVGDDGWRAFVAGLTPRA